MPSGQDSARSFGAKLTRRNSAALVVGAALFAVTGCSFISGGPTVTLGSDRVHLVEFPDIWTISDSRNHWLITPDASYGRFLVRRLRDPHPVLLFRVEGFLLEDGVTPSEQISALTETLIKAKI